MDLPNFLPNTTVSLTLFSLFLQSLEERQEFNLENKVGVFTMSP